MPSTTRRSRRSHKHSSNRERSEWVDNREGGGETAKWSTEEREYDYPLRPSQTSNAISSEYNDDGDYPDDVQETREEDEEDAEEEEERGRAAEYTSDVPFQRMSSTSPSRPVQPPPNPKPPKKPKEERDIFEYPSTPLQHSQHYSYSPTAHSTISLSAYSEGTSATSCSSVFDSGHSERPSATSCRSVSSETFRIKVNTRRATAIAIDSKESFITAEFAIKLQTAQHTSRNTKAYFVSPDAYEAYDTSTNKYIEVKLEHGGVEKSSRLYLLPSSRRVSKLKVDVFLREKLSNILQPAAYDDTTTEYAPQSSSTETVGKAEYRVPYTDSNAEPRYSTQKYQSGSHEPSSCYPQQLDPTDYDDRTPEPGVSEEYSTYSGHTASADSMYASPGTTPRYTERSLTPVPGEHVSW